MEKRGQITIFIIISIIIVGAVAGFFVFRDSLSFGGVPASIEPVYNSFYSCFEEISKEANYQIAFCGGYYNVPAETSAIFLTEEIPYFYLDSKNYVPSIRMVEKEFAEYVSKNLGRCLDLEGFRKQGFDINTEDYLILVQINENNIDVKLNSLITIKKAGDSAQIKGIELSVDSRIKNLHSVSREIVDSYAEKPGKICLTCLEELSEKNKVNIKVVPLSDVSMFKNNIIWFFITNKEDNSEDKLIWRFIVEQ